MNGFWVREVYEWQFRVPFEAFLAEFNQISRDQSRVSKFLRGVLHLTIVHGFCVHSSPF
jgi:hypothetical protein